MVLCLVLEEQIKKKQGRNRKSSGHIRKCLLIRKYESLTSSLLASNLELISTYCSTLTGAPTGKQDTDCR